MTTLPRVIGVGGTRPKLDIRAGYKNKAELWSVRYVVAERPQRLIMSRYEAFGVAFSHPLKSCSTSVSAHFECRRGTWFRCSSEPTNGKEGSTAVSRCFDDEKEHSHSRRP